MSKKIVILNGSPRKKGNTSMLGVSLWGWLATILSLVGGAAAFLNSRS